MKRFLALAMATYLLTGCSIFERRTEDGMEQPPFSPNSTADEAIPPTSENYMENELARLNTKIEALETKLSALSDNVDTTTARTAQPKLRAEGLDGEPPVADPSNDIDPEAPSAQAITAVSTKLPTTVKAAPPSRASDSMSADEAESEAEAGTTQATGNIEKDFQTAMKSLTSGNHKEAANRFFAISKQHRQHPLASHALYWAGESGARARNWKIAIAHWSNLEANYPRSVYISDALAGLAAAYGSAGSGDQSKHYRDVVMRAFPDSPATMNLTANLSDAHGEE